VSAKQRIASIVDLFDDLTAAEYSREANSLMSPVPTSHIELSASEALKARVQTYHDSAQVALDTRQLFSLELFCTTGPRYVVRDRATHVAITQNFSPIVPIELPKRAACSVIFAAWPPAQFWRF
jgi:hypothetical protein